MCIIYLSISKFDPYTFVLVNLINTYCIYGIRSIGSAMQHNDTVIKHIPITFVQNTPIEVQSAGTIKPEKYLSK